MCRGWLYIVCSIFWIGFEVDVENLSLRDLYICLRLRTGLFSIPLLPVSRACQRLAAPIRRVVFFIERDRKEGREKTCKNPKRLETQGRGQSRSPRVEPFNIKWIFKRERCAEMSTIDKLKLQGIFEMIATLLSTVTGEKRNIGNERSTTKAASQISSRQWRTYFFLPATRSERKERTKGNNKIFSAHSRPTVDPRNKNANHWTVSRLHRNAITRLKIVNAHHGLPSDKVTDEINVNGSTLFRYGSSALRHDSFTVGSGYN